MSRIELPGNRKLPRLARSRRFESVTEKPGSIPAPGPSYLGEYVGIHGRGCAGPCYRNRFGVVYCSWCGATQRLIPVSRLPKEKLPR